VNGKVDLWLYPGNPKLQEEPERSGCPKMHPLVKEKQHWENCSMCLRTKTGPATTKGPFDTNVVDTNSKLSEWRACIL
jgi:hypothetical protein